MQTVTGFELFWLRVKQRVIRRANAYLLGSSSFFSPVLSSPWQQEKKGLGTSEGSDCPGFWATRKGQPPLWNYLLLCWERDSQEFSPGCIVIDTFRISPLGGLPRQPSISCWISHHVERAESLLGVQKHPSELSTASCALSIPREKQRDVSYWRVQSTSCLGLDLTTHLSSHAQGIQLSEGLQGQDVLLRKWGKTNEL